MKLAAVNFNAVFADVEANLKQVISYVQQAAKLNVKLILFPEFFTSSMGFSEKMLDATIKSGHVEGVLKRLSRDNNIVIGGSYLYFDGSDTFNVFQLVFPGGTVYSHKKDIPTLTENCYYTNGDEEHILHTPIGDIGVAMCWEMVRYDTLKRLSQKVDFVLAGSCWEDLPEGAPLLQYNREFALKTPVTFAKLLRVPVIHSNHCGKVTAKTFTYDNQLRTQQMVGAAQIIDADGSIIARKTCEEGEGLIIAELNLKTKQRKHAVIDPEKYWIEELPADYLYAWETYNKKGRTYYEETARPYYIDNFMK